MRISGLRLMWLLVMFDLPVTSKKHRRDYRRFVDFLVDEGYVRAQYSVYVRPTATEENTAVHMGRIVDALPPAGEVRILKFTDKQWARMVVFRSRRREANEEAPEQFSFFDESLAPIVDGDACEDLVHKVEIERAEVEEPEETAPPRRIPAWGTKPEKGRRKKPKQETPGFDFFD